jgi:single-strand DNA-binding protein
MASVNKVILVGTLGRDPEIRYTQTQKAVGKLSVATSKFINQNGGERKQITEWHNVVVWEKNAENAGKYLAKGSSVYIEGELTTRSWDHTDGSKRYATEIVAHVVQYLSPGKKEGTQQAAEPSQGFMQNPNEPGHRDPTPDFGDDIPF